MSGTAGRMGAVLLRHWYLHLASWIRILDLMYWPVVQLLLWGFLTRFIAAQFADGVDLDDPRAAAGLAGGVLIGAVLLWDVLFRSQIGVFVGLLEEAWARNLGHLFIAPLRFWEWVAAIFTVAAVRLLVGLIPALLLAIPLFGFNMFGLGLPLVGFFAILMLMGWWLGLLTISLLLRHGMAAETLGWMAMFLLSPIVCIYYPVAVLPAWLQPVAWSLPATHAFEGMRAIMLENRFAPELMLSGLGLNLLWMSAALVVLRLAFRDARRRGALLAMGE